jgi:hypothetical protein
MSLQATTLFIKQRSAPRSNKGFMALLGNDFIWGDQSVDHKQLKSSPDK